MNLAPVVGSHDDVIVIHDGRLVSFDPGHGSIRWQLEGQFAGQPSVAHDRIYAQDGGGLAVLDEVTHAPLWSWQAPDGPLVGPMIVTDTHLLASTAHSVHALDLVTRQSVWTYPVGGALAMADGTLYVAGEDGMVTAIAAPRVVTSALAALEIAGPLQIVENSSGSFLATVRYANGATVDRTLLAEWSVSAPAYASFGAAGQLDAHTLITPSLDVVVRARYTERGQTVEGTRTVRLVSDVTPSQLVVRNLRDSIRLKQGILRDLDAALARERAALDVLHGLPATPWNAEAAAAVGQAISQEDQARSLLAWSLNALVRLFIRTGTGQPEPGRALELPLASVPAQADR